MPTDQQVLDELRRVRDPELDQSIVDLGFVAAVEIEGAAVRVRLRLPTFFCAPNFTYLMAGEAREILLEIPDVTEAAVTVDDHFTADEVSEGVNADRGFDEAFPGLAEGGLDGLRRLFHRKALLSRQHRVAAPLRRSGWQAEDLAGLTMSQVPPGPDLDEYERARTRLGIDVGPDAPFLVDGAGRAVPAAQAEHHLAQARSLAVSMSLNTQLCSGVLATRYPGVRPIVEETTA